MKYVCLLPTDGFLKGQTVEMTEAEYIAQNANEEHPRFAPATADVENATPETVVAEESGERQRRLQPKRKRKPLQ